MTAIHVQGIDHVVLRVTDVHRALDFYCDVLGCRIERTVEDIGLVQLRAGAALIDLVDVAGTLGRSGGAPAGVEARNVDHFALRIEFFDEDEIVAHLAAHGVAPGAVETRYGAEGEGPSMYITDPDGNGVELKGPPRGETRGE